MGRHVLLPVLYALLTIYLAATVAHGIEPGLRRSSTDASARRQLHLISLFDPLADLLDTQDQQEHSLMHMISGHRAAGRIPEYSSTDPIGLDMAEAMLQDQHQVPVDGLSSSPQKARLHSLSRSQALAKSKPHISDQSSYTVQTPPPVPVTQPSSKQMLTILSEGATEQLSNAGDPTAVPNDCAALIEHDAILSCLVKKVASLNAKLSASGVSDRAGSRGASQEPPVSSGRRQSSLARPQKLTRHDLVSVATSAKSHMPLVYAMRRWRKGMRGVIAFAKEQEEQLVRDARAINETWLAYPDDDPVRTSSTAADSRAALAPLLAHQALGDSYRWMLYGDDDTLFFVDAVLDLLLPFDPELPYAISDNIWFEANSAQGPPYKHPSFDAPRCLPCHFNHSRKILKLFTGFRPEGASLKPPLWGFPAVPGCPCTTELLCSIEEERPLYGVAGTGCANPPVPRAATYAVHGGAGVLLSVGLMRKLNFTQFEACVKSLRSSGGDAFFTICLWRSGFALTDPGFSVFTPDAKLFDPFQYEWYHDIDGELKIIEAIDKDQGLVEGGCDATCQVRLNMMVSAHVRSRARGVPYASAQIGILSAAYDQWRQRKGKAGQMRTGPSDDG